MCVKCASPVAYCKVEQSSLVEYLYKDIPEKRTPPFIGVSLTLQVRGHIKVHSEEWGDGHSLLGLEACSPGNFFDFYMLRDQFWQH